MNGSFFAMSDFEMINSSGRLISEESVNNFVYF